MTKSIVRIALAGAVGAVLVVSPAFAAKKPKWGDDADKKQQYTHEQVRKKQVRANAHRPFYQPIFHPLVGKNGFFTKIFR